MRSLIFRLATLAYHRRILFTDFFSQSLIFGGLSYCNVDRREVDGIITSLNVNTNIKIVNPDSENTLGAVISSVFKNYIHYTESDILGGLFND